MRKYYYANDKEKLGPFTISQLETHTLTRETLVWYEGLEEWVAAGQVEELLEEYFTPPPFPAIEKKEYSYIIVRNKATGRKERLFPHRWKEITEMYGADKYVIIAYIDDLGNKLDAEGGLVEKSLPPKSYLVESILVTLFCCLPAGVVGIIHAAKVESAFNSGNYQEAEEASQTAKMWTNISFWIGLVGSILYFILIIVEEMY